MRWTSRSLPTQTFLGFGNGIFSHDPSECMYWHPGFVLEVWFFSNTAMSPPCLELSPFVLGELIGSNILFEVVLNE